MEKIKSAPIKSGSIKLEPSKRPVASRLKMPGSKSITNRVILLAALTPHSVTIMHPLFSDDTKAMINCLRALGIEITELKDRIIVRGSIYDVTPDRFKLNADLSGTTLRFILPILTVIPGVKVLTGKQGLFNRPIKDLVEALVSLGARINYAERPGYPPLIIHSSSLEKNQTTIRGSISSQYLSSLLMLLPLINGGKIRIVQNLVSKPYVDLTISVMADFGVKVKNHDYKVFEVEAGQKYDASSYTVEGDYSSASYFAAIAALTKSSITLENLNPKSLQGDMEFINVIKSMGNEVRKEGNIVRVIGSCIKPVKVNMQDYPDQIQTLAVLASFAKGKTIISGIETLRIKETDRLTAVRRELKKMGIKTEISGKSLIIHGGSPKAAIIDTYGDHRMAMSFAIAGTKIPGMIIQNPSVVTKTFPDFWEALESLSVGVRDSIINNT